MLDGYAGNPATMRIYRPLIRFKEFYENRLPITIPKFEITGVDLDKDEPYCLYDTHSGLLSAPTPDIDTGELVAFCDIIILHLVLLSMLQFVTLA